MGQFDSSSDNSINPQNSSNPDAASSQAAEKILHLLSQDLKSLQQDLVSDLHQDVRRLQAEKSRLQNEIDKLQQQQQALQAQHEVSLSRQQLAQQQVWAKQLAIAMANHLYASLNQRLNQPGSEVGSMISSSPEAFLEGTGQLATNQISANPISANQLVASLGESVNQAIATLRNEINSHESALSQQLSRMHNLGQQGEALLEVLVGRINQHLQLEATRNQAFNQSPTNPPLPSAGMPAPLGFGDSATDSGVSGIPRPGSTLLPTAPASPPEGAFAPVRASLRPEGLSQFQLGLILILCSTLALSLHNVIVSIVLFPSKLFGAMSIGGFIQPGFGSSLWILFMRMLVVVPLMIGLANILYKPARRDIKGFILSRDRRLIGSVIGSGIFLFLSQIFIYIAIGGVGPGIAVTILFMYPLVTVPLAWWLFGDRPTRLRWLVMIAILSGITLSATSSRAAAGANFSAWGVWAAIASGICFALYLISMQISFRKLHPVPVSIIQFSTIFLLSLLSLIIFGVQSQPSDGWGLAGGGIILGALTLVGYLLNNFGVRFMGAARASIIAASGPALTALLSVVLIPGPRTFLNGFQILGILAVTLGVVTLSIERLLLQNQPVAKSTNAESDTRQVNR